MTVEYRLNSPTMAIEPEGGSDGRMHFVIIPAGALLTLAGEPQQSGLVDVLFEGRVVAMFLRDLQERGERTLGEAV